MPSSACCLQYAGDLLPAMLKTANSWHSWWRHRGILATGRDHGITQAARGKENRLEVPEPAYAHLLFVQPALAKKLSVALKCITANVHGVVSQQTLWSKCGCHHTTDMIVCKGTSIRETFEDLFGTISAQTQEQKTEDLQKTMFALDRNVSGFSTVMVARVHDTVGAALTGLRPIT